MPPNGMPNAGGTVSEQSRERRSERRVHLSEAAEIMGVSKDAVRMRVKRGTLRSEKGEDGRVYVWVNVTPDADPNGVHPEGKVDPYRELIATLREQLAAERRANEENRRIIAALTQRIPEIEAPASPEPREPSTAATEQPGRVEPQQQVEGQQQPAERVTWWRRVFGG